MVFKECNHCLTKVMFPENGICPACKADSNLKNEKTKEQIQIEQLKRRSKEQIANCKDQGPPLIAGGIALTVILVGLLIGLIGMGGGLRIRGVILVFVGLLFSIGLIGKGLNLLRDAKEIELATKLKIQKMSKSV